MHPPVRHKADNIYCHLCVTSRRFGLYHLGYTPASVIFNFGKTYAEAKYILLAVFHKEKML